jgi:hypothetical protein
VHDDSRGTPRMCFENRMSEKQSTVVHYEHGLNS